MSNKLYFCFIPCCKFFAQDKNESFTIVGVVGACNARYRRIKILFYRGRQSRC